MAFLDRYSPYLLSVLRIAAALLLLQHGTTKVLSFPETQMSGIALFGSLGGFAGVIELIGGLMLLVGLFTRATAFILSGTMAVAYFMAHAPQGFFPILNGGELAVLYCFAFLYLVAAGPGPVSVDAARKSA